MNKFLRVLFVLVIIAMTGAIIFQLFFPSYMGTHSGYGVSVVDEVGIEAAVDVQRVVIGDIAAFAHA